MAMIERLRCGIMRMLGCPFPDTNHEALYGNLLAVVKQRDAAERRLITGSYPATPGAANVSLEDSAECPSMGHCRERDMAGCSYCGTTIEPTDALWAIRGLVNNEESYGFSDAVEDVLKKAGF